MLSYNLRTILTLLSAVTVILALNVPQTSSISPTFELPCINVTFKNVPDDLLDQVPSLSLHSSGWRFRVANELPAKSVELTRGWPLVFEKQHGFLYEYGNEQTWVGIPIATASSVSNHLSIVALAVNVLVALSITILPITAFRSMLKSRMKANAMSDLNRGLH